MEATATATAAALANEKPIADQPAIRLSSLFTWKSRLSANPFQAKVDQFDGKQINQFAIVCTSAKWPPLASGNFRHRCFCLALERRSLV